MSVQIKGVGTIGGIDEGLNITGVTTATNFKTGTSNVHSTGYECTNVNATGVITATSFVGSGANLTGIAGLGTALSTVQSSPLNKLYYTDRVLKIGSTVTIDHPASASGAYTHYADIQVEDGADLIVADGDDLIPDIFGIGGSGTTGSGGAGRLLVDNILNRSGTGAPTFPSGAVVTGIVTATKLSATNVSAASSVTATTFYGSGAGLGGVPGGLDSIDRWQVQGNADRIDGTGVYQKLIMYGGSAGSGGCTTGTWYFSARDMSTRPTFFPHAIGAGVSFYSQEGGYTSNTDCHAGKDLTGVEASAGIVTFPSTGTWQITWDIVACVCSGGRLQFGIECTANIGAATTVWGSVFPHLWNFCKIQEPHYCDTGNRCCGIKHMYFETASTVHTYTRQIEAYVSVANTNQTGVRFSWGRDSNSNWITGGTGWTYKKVSNTAPW